MRKIFLFVSFCALSIGIASCSGDDNEAVSQPGGTVTLKMNGVAKTYNTVTVSKNVATDYTQLTLTASQNGGSTDMVKFIMEEGVTGADEIWSTQMTIGGASSYTSLSTNTTANSNNHVKGTFSGTATVYNSTTGAETIYNITEGNFEANY